MIKIEFKCDKCGHDKCKITANYGYQVVTNCIKCKHEEVVKEEAPTD